jgi:hypothetical protein
MPAAAWLPFNRRKQDGGGSKPYPVFILESWAVWRRRFSMG